MISKVYDTEYQVNPGIPQASILGPTLFLLSINDFPYDVICDIAIYADDAISILSVIRHLICGSNLNWLLNLNLIYKTLWTGVRSGLLISMLEKTQLVSFDHSNNNGSTDVKMGGSVLEEKSSLKLLELSFCPKLDWGSYVISVAKTASKKIGALIRSTTFFPPDVALYFYKCTIRPCMEYCSHIWAGVLSCYLELLDKL